MTPLKHDKYLVTGGAGFIGSHIAEEIVKQGKQVIVIDNLVNGSLKNFDGWWDDNLCTFVEAEVGNLDLTFDYYNNVDVVFHNAASKCTVCREDPLNDLIVNAGGSWCVFYASQLHGVKKVVHASTGSVNGGKPVSFYGVSKQAGESYLRAFAEYHPEFKFSCIRYHHVYGPRQDDSDKGGVIPIFIRNALNNEPIKIFGDGEQERNFTYVKDVIDFNFMCANEAKWNGAYLNFGNPESVTIKDLAEELLYQMEKVSVIMHYDARHGDIKKFNSNMFVRDYGYTPFDIGLKETINAFT